MDVARHDFVKSYGNKENELGSNPHRYRYRRNSYVGYFSRNQAGRRAISWGESSPKC